MEDKIKILETKLGLAKDILRIQNYSLYNLRELAERCENILIYNKGAESTEGSNLFTLNKEQLDTLTDLIYTVKSESLTSQNTSDYLKSQAREKEIKQEILNGL